MHHGTVPEAPTEDAAEQPVGQRGFARLQPRDRLPVLLLIVAVMSGAAMVGIEHPSFSPIDELPHYDYVTRLVDDHRIPDRLEDYSATTDRALACYGPAPWKMPLPPCDASPSRLRAALPKPNTAGGYPPVYYTGVAVAAVAIRPATAGNLFLAARLASALWLALGAVATYLLCRTVGSSRLTAFSLSAGAALAPAMLFQGSTVNPDAASLLCGAGAALAWLRLRDRRPLVAVGGLAAVLAAVALVKPNLVSIPPIVAAAELTLAAHLHGPAVLLRPATWGLRSTTGRVLASCGLGAVVGIGWSGLMLVILRAPNDIPESAAFGNAPWNWATVVLSHLRSLNPLSANLSYMPVLNGVGITTLATLLGLTALVGAVAGGLFGRDRELSTRVVELDGRAVDPVRPVGYLAAWSLVLAAPVTYALLAASHRFFPYQARYSLWTVPLGLATIAGLTGRRRGLVLVALGLATAALTMAKLVHGLPS